VRDPTGLFGELYLRSTSPFLTEATTRAEAEFLAARLPAGLRLDLGCGHGRHLGRVGPVAVGVDFDPASLRQAKAAGPVVRGDFRALPLRRGAVDGAYCWYNSLGTLEESDLAAALGELQRVLRRGGRVIVQGTNPAVARANPEARFEGQLADGSHLEEVTRWSEARGRDELTRRLVLPDGRIMAANFFIRYYDEQAWRGLLEARGLEVTWVVGGVAGSPVNDLSSDIIVGATKRD
jgi:SAM-dependent methyltransferase